MLHIDDLVQDRSNSIANALELLQSCTKPPIWFVFQSNERRCYIWSVFPCFQLEDGFQTGLTDALDQYPTNEEKKEAIDGLQDAVNKQ